ncbi:hypothetical protein FVP50_13530 [Staphylococcus aureus]|nr:hypothetical protein [Staphylococcus aureus]MCB4420993.1 hypothetical protein [Staphylococcus aureus]
MKSFKWFNGCESEIIAYLNKFYWKYQIAIIIGNSLNIIFRITKGWMIYACSNNRHGNCWCKCIERVS